MRKELIAAVSALALMTGAAFAQTSSTGTTSPGGTSDAAGMTTQNGAGTSNAAGPAAAGGTMGDQAQGSTSTSPASGSSTTADAEGMMGKTVYGDNDEKIGEVEDVILGANGEPQQLVVSSGGFLGIGAKQVAIDVSKAKLNAEENRVDIAGMAQKDVEALPEFEYSDSMTSLNRSEKGDASANKPEPLTAPPTAASPGAGGTATPMGGAATGSNNVNGGTSGQ